MLPAQYTSSTSGYQHVTIEGGILGDQDADTTQNRYWTGIRLYASANGSYLNTIRNVWIGHCSKGIELLMDDATPDSTGERHNQWANYNLFENVQIWDFEVGVDFNVHANVTPTGTGGFDQNTFRNITLKNGSASGTSPLVAASYGFKNIRHIANSFSDCIVQGFTGSSVVANIHSSAISTIILGGDMVGNQYADAGTGTKIIHQIATSAANRSYDSFYVDKYGAGDPSFVGIKAGGTEVAPEAVALNDVVGQLSGRGYDGSTITTDNRAAVSLRSGGTWSASDTPTYIDFQTTPSASTTPASVFRILSTGDIALSTTKKLLLDDTAGTGNTYLTESSADIARIVAGGNTIYEARSTHALSKAYINASDPTATHVPDTFFAIAKNTTGTPTYKLFYNDGGTLKTWGASDTAETLQNKTMSAVNNNFIEVLLYPNRRLVGGIFGGGGVASPSQGWGFAAGNIDEFSSDQVNTYLISSTEGKATNMRTKLTTPTSGDEAGVYMFDGGSVMRALKTVFKCKFRVDRLNTFTTNVICWVGLSGYGGVSPWTTFAAEPFANYAGIAVGFDTADSNFQIARNLSSASSTYHDTGVAKDTNIHKIVITANSGDTGWDVNFDDGAYTASYTTGDMPGSTTMLYPFCGVETTTSAQKDVEVFYLVAEANVP